MKKNMGTVDKVIRLVIALVIVILFLTHAISGTLALVLLILAGIFVVTSLIGFCPLYFLLGISTGKKQE
jgi:hypothetical protein